MNKLNATDLPKLALEKKIISKTQGVVLHLLIYTMLFGDTLYASAKNVCAADGADYDNVKHALRDMGYPVKRDGKIGQRKRCWSVKQGESHPITATTEQGESHPVKQGRSEECRVGKECRSRWSP